MYTFYGFVFQNTSDHGQAGISLEAYFEEILPSYFPEYQIAVKSARKQSRRNRKNNSLL